MDTKITGQAKPSILSHRILKLTFIVSLTLGCFLVLFLMYFMPCTSCLSGSVKSIVSSDSVKSLSATKSDKKLITMLLWIWPFGKPFDLLDCSSHFNIEGCFLTADRNLYNNADGVVFHYRDIHANLSNMPRLQRPTFQKWIWTVYESASNSPKRPWVDNLFNLTLSYRRGADIYVPYLSLIAAEGKKHFVPPRKSKLICWIVSHWEDRLVRVKYYNELKKHIEIHTYGRAFRKYISDRDFRPTIASCKFYLSFENSIDKDYITEKLLNPLSVGTVPVVLGPPRQDYENIIQGDAFIHVDDFPSAKELADYLLLLDKNKEMYLKYFEWQQHFKLKKKEHWPGRICRACDYLRRHKENQVANNISKWFVGVRGW